MFNKFFQNTRKPVGIMGSIMINFMNKGHRALSEFGLSQFEIKEDDEILDIGCGGGANVSLMAKKCPKGFVTGVDYSKLSVEKSISKNKQIIEAKRCKIVEGNVLNLEFNDESFTKITAFETIYFWNPIEVAFKEVYRVLKSKGSFMICNEVDGTSKQDEKWLNIIDGMSAYTKEELKIILEKIGFINVKTFTDEKKHWFCVIAEKK